MVNKTRLGADSLGNLNSKFKKKLSVLFDFI